MRRFIAVLAAAAAAIVLATTFLPPLIWPDAPAPPALAPFVESARSQLWTNASDGLRLPLHLTFVEARCGPNGAIALIFEEHRPPSIESRFAYVARGSMPASVDDAWSGGSGIAGSVLADDEFTHLLGSNPTRCGG